MAGTVGGALLALLFFGLFQACGILAARAALSGESAGIRLLVGSVWGSAMLQWFPVLFAFFLGFTLPAQWAGLGLALACGGLALAAARRRGAPRLSQGFSAFSRRRFLWAVLGVWLFFCYLVWHSFRWEGGAVYSSQATYGDMSMHLSFITSLANQGDFPPDYSLLPGTRLSYPFLSDSISATLYQLGAPLWFAYELPMWAAGAQVVLGAYAFFARLTGGRALAAMAWVLFFFNGGLGFLYFLGGGWDNFTRIFTAFYETPTNLVEENVRWVNVIVDMMLPQRATLFGWALLFPALYLLYRGVFEGAARHFLWAGLLAGAMPMVHTHSFLALGVVCGVWLLFSLSRAREDLAARVGKVLVLWGLLGFCLLKELVRGREDSPWFLAAAGGVLLLCLGTAGVFSARAFRRGEGKALLGTWGVLLAAALALALPQLCFWTFQQAGEGGFLRGHFGWVIGEDGYLPFYLKNLGLAFPLALGGLLLARGRDFFKLAPALGVWLLAELVEFQPNDYDNNKLLYPAFAFLCCGAAQCLARGLELLRSRRARQGAAAGVLAAASLSAALTMGREAVASYQVFSGGALELAQWVQENTAPQALVLTDTRHNNEIASLAGRNVVCGSPSYLYYHGLPYGEREQAARAMYESPEGARGLVENLGVDYILLSDFERASYQVDQEALDRLYPRVYDDGSRILYQVNQEDAT